MDAELNQEFDLSYDSADQQRRNVKPKQRNLFFLQFSFATNLESDASRIEYFLTFFYLGETYD